MDLLRYYPYLEGSHGRIRLRISQALLDRGSDWLKERARGQVSDLRIVPMGENRCRLKVQLSNRLLHHVGSLALRVLREEGMELHIHQPSATLSLSTLDGSIDTNIVGRDYGLPMLVTAVNEALGVEHAMEIRTSKWLGWTRYRVFFALHPFRILRKLLPAGIGRHVTEVHWATATDAMLLDFHWRHSGVRPQVNV